MALWALAVLHGDGTLPNAREVARDVARAATTIAEAAGAGGKGGTSNAATVLFSTQAMSNAAWAAAKLASGGGDADADADADARDDDDHDDAMEDLRRLVTAVATAAAAADASREKNASRHTPQGLANILWACATTRAPLPVVLPLLTTALRSATGAGRRALASAYGCKADDVAKPAADDVAAAIDAADRLGLTPDADQRKLLRGAAKALLTGETLGWQAAGRLEHAAFLLLGGGSGGAAGSVPRAAAAAAAAAEDVELFESLLARGAEAATAVCDARLTLEDGAASALLSMKDGPASTVRETRNKMLCVDDAHRLLSQKLRASGWKVTNWNRFARRDRAGSAWPSSGKFHAVTARLSPTKAAFEMAATAAACRLEPGGAFYAYGASSEGIHTAASSLPAALFEDAKVVVTAGDGPFAVLTATRTDASADACEAAGADAFKTTTTLTLPGCYAYERGERPRSDDAARRPPPTPWVTYPGLFAGGALDVMTSFLLISCEKRGALERLHSKKGAPARGGPPPAVLDFCGGSGVLALAATRAAPNARVVLTDADAVALLAARANVGDMSGANVSVLCSDAWEALTADETFDLILRRVFVVAPLPFLKDFARARISPPITPRYQSPTHRDASRLQLTPLPHDSTPTSLRMGDDPQQPARASRRAAGFHRADETFVGRATATETGRRGVDRRAAVRSDGGDVRRRGRGRRDVRGRGRSIRGLGRQKHGHWFPYDPVGEVDADP
jgi:16S rRNA G1207 methylase RsmC